ACRQQIGNQVMGFRFPECWTTHRFLDGTQHQGKDHRVIRQGLHELLVCPVGFVSDHLEILHDLDIEAKNYAWSLGTRLERTASLNDDPEFIDAIASRLFPLLSREIVTA